MNLDEVAATIGKLGTLLQSSQGIGASQLLKARELVRAAAGVALASPEDLLAVGTFLRNALELLGDGNTPGKHNRRSVGLPPSKPRREAIKGLSSTKEIPNHLDILDRQFEEQLKAALDAQKQTMSPRSSP